MTRLLVSVRDEQEARQAAAQGADLIDVKEPRAGALGAVPPQRWQELRAAVPGSIPMSVALGELLDTETQARAGRATMFQFAKIGLAGCAAVPAWRDRWLEAWSTLPENVVRVAVAYADDAATAPSPEIVLEAAPAARCRALLVDTATKDGRNVFDHLALPRLDNLFGRARQLGLRLVLAGSLRLDQLPLAISLAPDYVAIRGAVCLPDREGALAPALVAHWVARLAELSPACPSRFPLRPRVARHG